MEAVQSGSEGLEVLRRGHVDLAIADYRMPGMSGVDFIRNARKIAPMLPLYLFTAYASEEVEKQAMAAGARRYVSKREVPDRIAGYLRQDLGLENA